LSSAAGGCRRWARAIDARPALAVDGEAARAVILEGAKADDRLLDDDGVGAAAILDAIAA
jgi:hypothetical protein